MVVFITVYIFMFLIMPIYGCVKFVVNFYVVS